MKNLIEIVLAVPAALLTALLLLFILTYKFLKGLSQKETTSGDANVLPDSFSPPK